MAKVFDWDCNGLADVAVVTGAVETGSITTLTPIIGGSILEYDGISNTRLDTSGTVGVDAALNITFTTGTLTFHAVTGNASAQSQVIILFRIATAGNFYGLTLDNGTVGISLNRFTSNVVDLVLGSHSTGYAADTKYVFTLAVVGNTFSVYRNGVFLFSATDATYAANLPLEVLYYSQGSTLQTRLGRLTIDDEVNVPGGGWGGGTWGASALPFRSSYNRRERTAGLFSAQSADAVFDGAFFPTTVQSPLYIGAAGQSTVYKGATAATTKYLGPRTLF